MDIPYSSSKQTVTPKTLLYIVYILLCSMSYLLIFSNVILTQEEREMLSG